MSATANVIVRNLRTRPATVHSRETVHVHTTKLTKGEARRIARGFPGIPEGYTVTVATDDVLFHFTYSEVTR